MGITDVALWTFEKGSIVRVKFGVFARQTDEGRLARTSELTKHYVQPPDVFTGNRNLALFAATLRQTAGTLAGTEPATSDLQLALFKPAAF